MSTKTYIKRAIRNYVRDNSVLFQDYGNWYIGITSDPDRREREHGSKNVWGWWKANSSKEARAIEAEFLEAGMEGGTGGGKNTRYVYVFKHSGPGS